MARGYESVIYLKKKVEGQKQKRAMEQKKAELVKMVLAEYKIENKNEQLLFKEIEENSDQVREEFERIQEMLAKIIKKGHD